MNRFISNLKGKIDTYTKTETETKLNDVKSLLEEFIGFTAETVTTLPDSGREHVLYFLEQDSSGIDKDYKVYIYLDGKYELIGENTVNMQPYTTVGEFNTMVAQYNNHSHGYATKEWVNELLGVRIPATILLEASETIIQQGDTTILTATVLDVDGEPVPNVEVSFGSVGSDITNSLGSSITNSNGVATFTYNGTGAGDKSIQATINTITSNTITIEDCIYQDDQSTDKTGGYTVHSNSLSNITVSNLNSENENILSLANATNSYTDTAFTITEITQYPYQYSIDIYTDTNSSASPIIGMGVLGTDNTSLIIPRIFHGFYLNNNKIMVYDYNTSSNYDNKLNQTLPAKNTWYTLI